MNLVERAAYIKGLAEGLGLDAEQKETRVIQEMLELMSEMAGDVEAIGEDLGDLYHAVEQIDEDLNVVEEEMFGDPIGNLTDEMYEIVCPNCEESIHVDEEVVVSGNVVCSACGEKIEVEIDECGCGCGHDHDDE